MNPKILKQRKADLFAAMKAKQAQMGASDITAEQRATLRAEFAALEAEFAQNGEDIAAAERLAEIERTMAPVADADNQAQQRAAAVAQVTVTERADADPKRGFKDHRDYMKAVMNAGMGRKVDQRLVPLRQATQGSDEQGTYGDPVGGFLVPHGVAPGILSLQAEDDPFMGRVTAVTMNAPTISYNARVDKNHSTSVSGGFTVSRRAETVDGTASRMTFEQVTLRANAEFGLAYCTEEMLTDSPQSFVDIISAGFRDEFVANAISERINGTGTGERQGILSTPCAVSVAKETGQAAATIVKENIDKMEARCWKFSRAIWLANHNTRPQLKSIVQVVGTGGNSVAYFQGNNGGQETLSGRPIFFTEYAKTLGTVGDLMLIVPSEYLEGTYQGEQFAESIHVRFVGAERAFRFYRRNDGQWWWRSALTPKNGNTLSPVVTLATR